MAYDAAMEKLQKRDPLMAETGQDLLRLKIVQIAKLGVSDPLTLSGLALDLMPSFKKQDRRTSA